MKDINKKYSSKEQRALVVSLCNELKQENAFSVEDMKLMTSDSISDYIDNLIADKRIRQNGYAKSEHNPAMIGMAIKLVWEKWVKPNPSKKIVDDDFVHDVTTAYKLFRKARAECEKQKVLE